MLPVLVALTTMFAAVARADDGPIVPRAITTEEMAIQRWQAAGTVELHQRFESLKHELRAERRRLADGTSKEDCEAAAAVGWVAMVFTQGGLEQQFCDMLERLEDSRQVRADDTEAKLLALRLDVIREGLCIDYGFRGCREKPGGGSCGYGLSVLLSDIADGLRRQQNRVAALRHPTDTAELIRRLTEIRDGAHDMWRLSVTVGSGSFEDPFFRQ